METNTLSYLLELNKPHNPNYKLPNIMKRNARYRGQRESEKTLNDHQEQIYDIRKHHSEIELLTNIQDVAIKSWFVGEIEASEENLMIDAEQKLQVVAGQKSYGLITDRPVRSFNNVMVKLDGVIVDPSKYRIENGHLLIDPFSIGDNSSPLLLDVSYTAILMITHAYIQGIYDIKKNMQQLDERLKEAERRYQEYENAYE